jgi:coenzyme Q-binding protein COQ10
VERVLPYSPDQLFSLVGDVARYPEFVPWITGLKASPVRNIAEGVENLDAEASVGFSFLKEKFATSVRRDAAQKSIEVGLLRGPFRKLSNRWKFEPDPAGTKVIFDIEFEFKSRLLDAMLVANFDRAVNRLISCFEDRARALYGR